VSLGEPNAADVVAVRKRDRPRAAIAVHDFRAPAADVEHHDASAARPVSSGEREAAQRACEGQARLLVTGDRPRRHAEALLDVRPYRVASPCVAHRARPDHVGPAHAEARDDLRIVVEACLRALHGLRSELSRLVDALTEPRDRCVLFDRDELAVAHLGDEQEHGVGADVDGRDAHGGSPLWREL
jgi:hypothetical protein